MARITPVNLPNVQGPAKELLDAVKAKLGIVPNMTRSMAVAPSVLDAYLGFSGALSHGVLPERVREQLGLDVGAANHCDYCVAFIFLMDYANQQRVKLWGNARVVEDDAELLERLRAPDDPGKVERAIVFSIAAWDINCPQHIQQRFSQRQVQPVIEQLQQRISELEAQLAQLQAHDPNPSPV